MVTPGEGTRLIRALRLRNQGLIGDAGRWATVPDVARGMVALQAQDPKGVLLALSLRCAGRPTEADVAAEFASARVVRNRPSRGTLQATVPEDMGWMSALLTPRSNASAVKRRDQIGVTEQMVSAVEKVMRSELSGGRVMTRPELIEACAGAGVELDGTQAGHVMRHHTEVMTIVFAGIAGRVDSFALADEWISERRELGRSEALAELATRYFTARGPATVQCMAWWANLVMGDARDAIDAAGPALEEIEIDGTTFVVAAGSAQLSATEVDAILAEPLLLPSFDEYLLGYRSREAVITADHLDLVVPGRNGMFKPIIVVDGEVVGIWSRRSTSKKVTVTLQPFEEIPVVARDGLARRVDEYGSFLGLEPSLVIDG